MLRSDSTEFQADTTGQATQAQRPADDNSWSAWARAKLAVGKEGAETVVLKAATSVGATAAALSGPVTKVTEASSVAASAVSATASTAASSLSSSASRAADVLRTGSDAVSNTVVYVKSAVGSYAVSKLSFFNSKTTDTIIVFSNIVTGKSLWQCVVDRDIYVPDQYLLRRTFIDFLRLAKKNHFQFNDVLSKAVVYGVENQSTSPCWTIVTGRATVSENAEGLSKSNVVIICRDINDGDARFLLLQLALFAELDEEPEYTTEIDGKVLSFRPGDGKEIAAVIKPESKPKPFSLLSDDEDGTDDSFFYGARP